MALNPYAAIGLAGAASLPGLFAGNAADQATTATAGDLSGLASTAAGTSSALTSESQSALNPVLKYYQGLLSGSPEQSLAATEPQVGRVIDQYDTARRSAAAFTPRGGGQASGNLQSRIAEASDISGTINSARSGAASALGNLGLGTASASAAQAGIAGNDLGTVLKTYLQQSQNSQQAASGFGSAVGSILGLLATAA